MVHYNREIKYFLVKKLAFVYFFRIGKLRSWLYTRLMAKVGKGVFIFPPFRCTAPEGIRLGHNINISNNCVLGGEGGLRLGNFVMVGPNCTIVTSNHGSSRGDIPMVRQKQERSPVKIADDVWMGANCVVLPGVTIGQGVIIGAGSVVTRDVAPYTVVAGNPAREIKKRFGQEEITRLLAKDSPLYRYYKNDYLETSTPTVYFSG